MVFDKKPLRIFVSKQTHFIILEKYAENMIEMNIMHFIFVKIYVDEADIVFY